MDFSDRKEGACMARPRQPINLVEAKGKKHLTKEEIENRKAQEVQAPSDNIRAPSYLPDDLKITFDEISGQLLDVGIMTNLDCESLARFLVAENEYQRVSIRLMKMKSFGERYMDLLKIQEKLFKQARASASDLGLSISSRCKLVIPTKKDDDQPSSKWSKFV
jgi:P27 family predicted phage terminase small subunit